MAIILELAIATLIIQYAGDEDHDKTILNRSILIMYL